MENSLHFLNTIHELLNNLIGKKAIPVIIILKDNIEFRKMVVITPSF